MLVTNPPARATLPEVLNHPWMIRNFSGPPSPHLIHREPLRPLLPHHQSPSTLDRDVLRGMTGFEFGTESEIEARLLDVLESDDYRRAVEAWERRKQRVGGGQGTWESTTTFGGGAADASSASIESDGLMRSGTFNSMASAAGPPGSSPTKKGKRFSGFDYYRKKLFPGGSEKGGSSQPTSPTRTAGGIPNSMTSTSSFFGVDAYGKEIPDPTRGYHPLLSIYYLVREKMEREKVYGPGVFASSQLSLMGVTDHAPGAVTVDAGLPDHLKTGSGNVGVPAFPDPPAPQAAKTPPPLAPDYNMPLPRLPPPSPAHSPTTARHEGIPSPITVPGKAAQQQALGRGEAVDMGPQIRPSTSSPVGGAEMPRTPPKTTHRRSASLNQRPSVLRGWAQGVMHGGQTGVSVFTCGREVGD